MEKRKEECKPANDVHSHNIHEIDPRLLSNPSMCRQSDYYLGRGSFGIMTLKMYRGIYVAIKKMHAKSAFQDVIHEAKMLSCLCHPFLPYLLKVCTSNEPFKIVTLFHGFLGDQPYSITIRRELDQPQLRLNDADWISASA